MSNIQLVGYFHEEPGYLKTHSEVKLEDIAFTAQPHPKNGITLLYGFRDALDEMSRRQNIAAGKGLDTFFIEATVDVGQIIQGLVSPEKLPKTNMINLGRITVALEDTIVDYWRKYLKKHGVSKDQASEIDWGTGLKYISAAPYLLDDLIQEPEFKHLNAIIYPITTTDGHTVKVATVFNKAAIKTVQVRHYPNVKVTY